MKLPKLKEVRERRGLSQLELSELSGVSTASISSLETEERSAHPSVARRLASSLNTTVEELMLNPGDATWRVKNGLQRTRSWWTEEQYLQARVEDAFPQLFDRKRLQKEQVEETLEVAQLILGDLGRTMSMTEADSLFEAVHPALTAEEFRQVCVGLYLLQRDKEVRLP